MFILKLFGIKKEEKQKMFMSVTDLLMEKHFVLKCIFIHWCNFRKCTYQVYMCNSPNITLSDSAALCSKYVAPYSIRLGLEFFSSFNFFPGLIISNLQWNWE